MTFGSDLKGVLRYIWESVGMVFSRLLFLIITLAIVAVLVSLYSVLANASDIGFAPFNGSVTKFWNTGPQENETYITRDLSQIANADVGRFSWGHYSDCLFSRHTITNNTQMWCPDRDSPFNGSAVSDNVSFWSMGGDISFGIGLRDNKLGKNYSQRVYDEYVNRTIWWDPNLVISFGLRDWWLGFCIDQINISSDSVPDALNFQASGQDYGFLLNDSRYWNLMTFNITSQSVHIGDTVKGQGIEWRYTDGTGNGLTWNGSQFCVLDFVSTGRPTTRQQSSFQWIDVPVCTLTPPAGCIYDSVQRFFGNILQNNGNSSPQGGIPIKFRVNWLCGLEECLPACSETLYSDGCFFALYDQNNTGAGYNDKNYTLTNYTTKLDPVLRGDKQDGALGDYATVEILPGGNTSMINYTCYTPGNYSGRGCFRYNTQACKLDLQNTTGQRLTTAYNLQCNAVVPPASVVSPVLRSFLGCWDVLECMWDNWFGVI